MSERQCPTCGGAVEVRGSNEGTNHYIPVGHAEYVAALAENARLQAQVEGLDRELSNLDCGRKSGQVCDSPERICIVHWLLVLRDRDRYKARAKRRKDALGGLLAYVEEMAARTVGQPKELIPDKRIGVARAAIEEEKE